MKYFPTNPPIKKTAWFSCLLFAWKQNICRWHWDRIMKKKEMWLSCDNGIYHFVILFQSYNVMPKICERGSRIKCRRRHFIYRMYNTLYCYTFVSFFPFSFVYASIFNARWYLNICANNMRVLMYRLNQNIEMREKKNTFEF